MNGRSPKRVSALLWSGLGQVYTLHLHACGFNDDRRHTSGR